MLTRKIDEVITIGENGLIRVMVVSIQGDKVRLGIEAPPEVAVHREEIFDAIKREREQK